MNLQAGGFSVMLIIFPNAFDGGGYKGTSMFIPYGPK